MCSGWTKYLIDKFLKISFFLICFCFFFQPQTKVVKILYRFKYIFIICDMFYQNISVICIYTPSVEQLFFYKKINSQLRLMNKRFEWKIEFIPLDLFSFCRFKVNVIFTEIQNYCQRKKHTKFAVICLLGISKFIFYLNLWIKPPISN